MRADLCSYAEAIDILYAHNTFHFNRLWALHFFRRTTLPKRFALIRRVIIRHAFSKKRFDGADANRITSSTSEGDWNATCKAFLAMSGLRELQFLVEPAFFLGASRPHTLIGAFQKLKGIDLEKEAFEIQMRVVREWQFWPDGKAMEEGLNASGVKCRVTVVDDSLFSGA